MTFRSKLILLFWSATVLSAEKPNPYFRVDKDLSDFDLQLTQMHRVFKTEPKNIKDRTWIKKKLKHMFDVDQYMHDFSETPLKNEYAYVETEYFWKEFPGRSNKVDSTNTQELKELLEHYTWFKISEFGTEADRQASLIVQHSDLDLPFQRKVIEILKNLYPKKETDASNFAYLVDRVAALNEKKPQRYGTQGKCAGPGVWQPFPLEDQVNVDKYRSEVGLEPLENFRKKFDTICR